MGLLTLKDHKLEINPNYLEIPALKKIWERDKDKEKHTAYKEMLYVYYICDFKSPYANYPEMEKIAKVNEAIMSPKYKPDSDLAKLIKEYKEHQDKSSPSLQLLMAAREAMHKLSTWLREVDYDEVDPTKVTRTMGDIKKIIDSSNILEEKVKKEITTSARARGGGRKGMYED